MDHALVFVLPMVAIAAAVLLSGLRRRTGAAVLGAIGVAMMLRSIWAIMHGGVCWDGVTREGMPSVTASTSSPVSALG